jgi:hypothetical protein
MTLFKGAEELQAARERREHAKAEEKERKRLDRRAKPCVLHEGGVLAEGDDGSSLSDVELIKRVVDYRRQQTDERMKQIKQRSSLRALGVIVKEDGSVCDLTWGVVLARWRARTPRSLILPVIIVRVPR